VFQTVCEFVHISLIFDTVHHLCNFHFTSSIFLALLRLFSLPCFLCSDLSQVLAFLYVLFFYFYLFFGAAPTATINGTAVSLMPELSVAGSGLQFAIQNVGKLVIPAVGGVVLEIMNHTVR